MTVTARETRLAQPMVELSDPWRTTSRWPAC